MDLIAMIGLSDPGLWKRQWHFPLCLIFISPSAVWSEGRAKGLSETLYSCFPQTLLWILPGLVQANWMFNPDNSVGWNREVSQQPTSPIVKGLCLWWEPGPTFDLWLVRKQFPAQTPWASCMKFFSCLLSDGISCLLCLGWWWLDAYDLGHWVQACGPGEAAAVQRLWHQYPGQCEFFMVV